MKTITKAIVYLSSLLFLVGCGSSSDDLSSSSSKETSSFTSSSSSKTSSSDEGLVVSTKFKIIINGTDAYDLRYDGAWDYDVTYTQYSYTEGLLLSVGDLISFYDVTNKNTWYSMAIDSSSKGSLTQSTNGLLVGKAGSYDIYIKMKLNHDNIYLGPHGGEKTNAEMKKEVVDYLSENEKIENVVNKTNYDDTTTLTYIADDDLFQIKDVYVARASSLTTTNTMVFTFSFKDYLRGNGQFTSKTTGPISSTFSVNFTIIISVPSGDYSLLFSRSLEKEEANMVTSQFETMTGILSLLTDAYFDFSIIS